MRVSIAMASYNGGRFLQEQLASFAAQTRLPDELVVTDDGSTDNTLDLLEGLPFPVRIERNPERLGVHRNFERALSLASGDIILISDQDDIWYPAKIETVVRAFAENPDALAVYHDEHIMQEGRILPGTSGERTRAMGIKDHSLSIGKCTALRKEALAILLPFPEGFGYDEWINWLPDVLGARVVIDMPLQVWRRHDANASQPAAINRFNNPRRYWLEQRRKLGVLQYRIAERDIARDRVADAMGDTAAEMARLSERLRTTSLSRPKRWFRVARLWFKGFYGNYSGWKSALKDALIS